ncbi:MAG: hypothetical protein LUD29_02160 [Clostridia bacterium]|nr:hypothetical protein [Clostridia bacterium]
MAYEDDNRLEEDIFADDEEVREEKDEFSLSEDVKADIESVEEVDLKEILWNPEGHETFELEYYPGQNVIYEQLATVELKGKTYAYLRPVSRVTNKKGSKEIKFPVDSTFCLDESVTPNVLRPVSNIVSSNKVLSEYFRLVAGKKTKGRAILKKNIYG